MKLSVMAARHEDAMRAIQQGALIVSEALKIAPPEFTGNRDKGIADLLALESLAAWLATVASAAQGKRARKAE